MKIIGTRKLDENQKRTIISLWNQEFPEKVSLSGLKDFNDYLQELSDRHHLILIDHKGSLQGWLMHFIRDDERFFTMVLNSSVQGNGWGSTLLDKAKETNSELNGWIVGSNSELRQDGEPYTSPIGFYKKNGFDVDQNTKTTLKGINVIKIAWREN